MLNLEFSAMSCDNGVEREVNVAINSEAIGDNLTYAFLLEEFNKFCKALDIEYVAPAISSETIDEAN